MPSRRWLRSIRRQPRPESAPFGWLPASVRQQLRQPFTATGESRVDRVDFRAVAADLPLQPAPLGLDIFKLLQQQRVHLATGPLLTGCAALHIVALTAQGHQPGFSGGDQRLDLLDLALVGTVEVGDTGIQPQQGFIRTALAALLLLCLAHGTQLIGGWGSRDDLLDPAIL